MTGLLFTTGNGTCDNVRDWRPCSAHTLLSRSRSAPSGPATPPSSRTAASSRESSSATSAGPGSFRGVRRCRLGPSAAPDCSKRRCFSQGRKQWKRGRKALCLTDCSIAKKGTASGKNAVETQAKGTAPDLRRRLRDAARGCVQQPGEDHGGLRPDLRFGPRPQRLHPRPACTMVFAPLSAHSCRQILHRRLQL